MAIPATQEGLTLQDRRPGEEDLTERELSAYRFVARTNAPGLSPDTSAKLFGLFLTGTTCLEIARLNRGINLGQVVRARVEGRWDERRREYAEGLVAQTQQRVQQAGLESIEFLTNQLAAAHRLHGDRVKRYLQSGDEADLGSFAVQSLAQYQTLVGLLRTLTAPKEAPTRDPGYAPEAPPAPRVVASGEARQALRAELERRRSLK